MIDTTAAEQNLIRFILEMNRIEKKYGEIIDENEETLPQNYQQELKKELEDIFQSFCTKKQRKYGRIENLFVSTPPIYGENEKIKKIEIDTKIKMKVYTIGDNPFNPSYRYTMLNNSGEWLVDHKELFCISEQKWTRVTL